jgi:hypothetical protein
MCISVGSFLLILFRLLPVFCAVPLVLERKKRRDLLCVAYDGLGIGYKSIYLSLLYLGE